eukprot:4623172-Pleurochrysis_carterae.AAC.2
MISVAAAQRGRASVATGGLRLICRGIVRAAAVATSQKSRICARYDLDDTLQAGCHCGVLHQITRSLCWISRGQQAF